MSNYLNYNYMKQTTGKDKNNDSDLDCKFNLQTHYKIESSNEDRYK